MFSVVEAVNLPLLLGIYFALVSLYTLSVPLFEAPDAYYHFAVIEHIADTGERPPTENPTEQPWRQMTFHAPLYHLMAGFTVRVLGIDTGNFPEAYPLNPHAQIGEPSAEHNYNFVAHTGDPWRGAGLAARVSRGISMLLGALTLIGVYGLGWHIFGPRSRLALLATAIVLFNPQFLFMNAVINNDNLVTALATLTLAFSVRIVRNGIDLPHVIFGAILAALTALSKASGLAIYVGLIVSVLWVCRRDRVKPIRVGQYLMIILVAFLLIAGWWYLENWVEFGEPTSSTMVAQATGTRAGGVDLISELRGLYYSFWGLFGWFNLPAPRIFYLWTIIMLLVAVGGVINGLRAEYNRISLDDGSIGVLLLLYTVTIIGGWWLFNQRVLAAQGRLWFPILGALACTMTYGWSRWQVRKPLKLEYNFGWYALLLTPMIIACLLLPFTVIRPAYQSTAITDATKWQPPAQTVADLELENCIAGDTAYILSQYDSMPDGGRVPLPMLRPGIIVNEQVRVSRPIKREDTRTWRLQVGLYDAGGYVHPGVF